MMVPEEGLDPPLSQGGKSAPAVFVTWDLSAYAEAVAPAFALMILSEFFNDY